MNPNIFDLKNIRIYNAVIEAYPIIFELNDFTFRNQTAFDYYKVNSMLQRLGIYDRI